VKKLLKSESGGGLRLLDSMRLSRAE
jgi:hypothetical protein